MSPYFSIELYCLLNIIDNINDYCNSCIFKKECNSYCSLYNIKELSVKELFKKLILNKKFTVKDSNEITKVLVNNICQFELSPILSYVKYCRNEVTIADIKYSIDEDPILFIEEDNKSSPWDIHMFKDLSSCDILKTKINNFCNQCCLKKSCNECKLKSL